MKLIPLNRGKFAQVDDEDFEWLNQWKWAIHFRSNNYYCERSKYLGGGRKNTIRETIQMHRVIMGCKKGDRKIIDHKDRNGLNNQKGNLREVNSSQNNSNRRPSKNGTSKYLGVFFESDRKKWTAHIRKDNNGIRLGSFNTEIEAAKAYNEAAKKCHGEFANLNII